MNSFSRRSFVTSALVAPFAFRSTLAGASDHVLYIGTYTGKEKGEGSRGIYRCQWNDVDGTLSPAELAVETPNPSFLVGGSGAGKGNFLYAVNEVDTFAGASEGSVSRFRVPAGRSLLQAAGMVGSGGRGPCHLALDGTGRCLAVANYDGGSVASFSLRESVTAVSRIPFSGHGADRERQEAAHTHCVTFSPGNGFLLVNDLGLDRIMVFRVDPSNGKIEPHAPYPFYSAKPGAGPRHGRFHPNGRWFYSVNELHSTVDHLGWEERAGTLTYNSTAPMLPRDFPPGKSLAAEVAIDPAGRFLYASNRGDGSMGGEDTIAIFSIEPQSGTLHLIKRSGCGGKEPRHFAIDPSGRWLLAANQKTNEVVVFRRDRDSGELTPAGHTCKVSQPVCLLFA